MITIKKIVLIILVSLMLCGCTKVEEKNYDEIINEIIASKYEIINNNRTGYKYYLPSNIGLVNSMDYNEILEDSDLKYYFYIDVISYFNRVIENYEIDENAYYSKVINYQDKYGYIEINKVKQDKYLLEIMYNYAKIEVMVDDIHLKDAIANAIVVLSSVNYNNEILQNLVGENVLTSKEIEFNIFETKKTESNFLEVQSNDIYKEENTNDPDLVV